MEIENSISSEQARVEDPVTARIVREVRVGGRLAIPEGTKVIGSITQVERGGHMKTTGKLVLRFHTLSFADGTQVRIRTESVYREGDEPGKTAATKIGGAALGGALLGALLGGSKGAATGAAIGAAGGTAATMTGARSEAVLQGGSAVTVRLTAPVTITVER
jgi:hypothetical protein